MTLLFIPGVIIYNVCGEEQTAKMNYIGAKSRYGVLPEK